MTDNIIKFTRSTTPDQPAAHPLEAAIAEDLEIVVVVGKTKDGDLWFGGNTSDVEAIIYLLAVAKKQTMDYH